MGTMLQYLCHLHNRMHLPGLFNCFQRFYRHWLGLAAHLICLSRSIAARKRTTGSIPATVTGFRIAALCGLDS
jgi:hypothetical protein